MTVNKDAPIYGAVATPVPTTNVQVIAPATLQAGYTFDAMYDGATFTVVVPDGGVSKGQRFIVAVPAEAPAVFVSEGDEGKEPRTRAGGGGGGGGGGGRIPTGIWRDGLCECFRFGVCHPHVWNSLCFRSFLIGQIMTRMKMTWLGQRTHDGDGSVNLYDSRIGTDERWRDTFRNIAIVTVLFFGYSLTTATVDMGVLDTWITTLFAVYVLYILIQLRSTLRHVYSIPEESCLFWYQLGLCGNNPREGVCGSGGNDNGSKLCAAGVPVGWEDICCALWCQLCVVAQMARHTADYEEKEAVCCNNVGVLDWDDDEAYEGVEAGIGEGSVLVV